MNALGQRMREMIASEGPISVERFMALALNDPQHGYYMTRDPLGAAGDFVTAPEISQMFGELLGVWAADLWLRMGAPKPLRLIELGPGRGTLMADALRAARACPEFLQAIDVHLIETSPILAAKQQSALANAEAPVTWRRAIETAPPGPAIILANEFFDALPVRHYVRTASGWRQRVVGMDAEGALLFGAAAEPESLIDLDAPPGTILEVGAVAQALMAGVARRLVEQGGAALAIDYGYLRTGLGETLQAVRGHAPTKPLANPGEADLTAHVDFSALARAAMGAGATVYGPVEQGDFLRRLGIEARAARLKRDASAEQARTIDSALARLTGGNAPGSPGMGRLFKVLAVACPACPAPAGFAEAHV